MNRRDAIKRSIAMLGVGMCCPSLIRAAVKAQEERVGKQAQELIEYCRNDVRDYVDHASIEQRVLDFADAHRKWNAAYAKRAAIFTASTPSQTAVSCSAGPGQMVWIDIEAHGGQVNDIGRLLRQLNTTHTVTGRLTTDDFKFHELPRVKPKGKPKPAYAALHKHKYQR